MPLYEFECRACGRSFEELVRSAASSSDASSMDGAVCEHCGSSDVERQLAAFRTGSSSRGASSPRGAAAGGGGCCGGHCACH